MSKKYDLVVLGGSIAGYETAMKAASLGLKTAIVEENRIGGIQTMAADMPLRTLLENDRTLKRAAKAAQSGVDFGGASFKPSEFYESIRKNADSFSRRLVNDLKEADIDVYLGHGIAGPNHTLSVMREGSKPRYLEWDKLVYAAEPVTDVTVAIKDNLSGYYTNENYGLLDDVPAGLIIYGVGQRACQAALIWTYLGAQVYLIVPGKELLPGFPKEIQDRLKDDLKEHKVNVFTGSHISEIYQDSSGVFHTQIVGGEGQSKSISASDLIIMTGQNASLDGLGSMNLALKDGWIATNEYLETSNPDVYTWTGSKQSVGYEDMTKKASEYLAKTIAGAIDEPFRRGEVIRVFDANPSYAFIGEMDRSRLEELGAVVGTSRIFGDEKADFIEIALDPELSEIVGAHAYGDGAKEVIGALAMVKAMEGTAEDILIANFPSSSPFVGIQEAVEDALDKIKTLEQNDLREASKVTSEEKTEVSENE